MARSSVSYMTMKKSLIFSVGVHLLFLALLIVTMTHNVTSKPMMINLQNNTKPGKNIIKAGIVDRRAIDRAHQQLAREERIKAEKAVELANIQKAQQEAEVKKLEQQRLAQQQKIAHEQKLVRDKAQQKIAQEKAIQEKAVQQKLAKDKMLKDKAMQERVAQNKLAREKANDMAKQQKIKQEQIAAGARAEKDRLSAQHDAFLATEVDKYKAEFTAAIIDNRILSSLFDDNLSCTIRIMLLPDGSILTVNIEKSSGNKAYDEMSENAIYKTAPFPMPQEQELYSKLRDIIISFKNGDHGGDVL